MVNDILGDVDNNQEVDLRDLVFFASYLHLDNQGQHLAPEKFRDIKNARLDGVFGITYNDLELLAKYVLDNENVELIEEETIIFLRQIDSTTQYKSMDDSIKLCGFKLVFRDNIDKSLITNIPNDFDIAVHENKILLYTSVANSLSNNTWTTLFEQGMSNDIEIDSSGIKFVNQNCEFVNKLNYKLINGYFEPEPEPEPQPM